MILALNIRFNLTEEFAICANIFARQGFFIGRESLTANDPIRSLAAVRRLASSKLARSSPGTTICSLGNVSPIC